MNTGRRSDPRTLAPYAYALNDPTSRVDPSGRSAASLFDGAAGYAYAGTAFYDDPGAQPSAGARPFGQSAAYAIAGVFRDLDSSDRGTQAAAVAKLAVPAVAVAIPLGIVAAPVLGGSAVAGSATTGTVFIGETAARVAAAASAAGGIAYKAPQLPPGPERMQANIAWIQGVMRQGLTIIDIGQDPAKVERGLAIGRYYLAELRQISQAAYEFYYPIFRR